MKSFALALPWVFAAVSAVSAVSPAGAVEFLAGAAREDVSPTTPVRLSGYASRQTEVAGVALRLWAMGLAISEAGLPAAVRVVGGLEIERVASESLVTDRIAVDWDARGRLWVLDMGGSARWFAIYELE